MRMLIESAAISIAIAAFCLGFVLFLNWLFPPFKVEYLCKTGYYRVLSLDHKHYNKMICVQGYVP